MAQYPITKTLVQKKIILKAFQLSSYSGNSLTLAKLAFTFISSLHHGISNFSSYFIIYAFQSHCHSDQHDEMLTSNF